MPDDDVLEADAVGAVGDIVELLLTQASVGYHTLDATAQGAIWVRVFSSMLAGTRVRAFYAPILEDADTVVRILEVLVGGAATPAHLLRRCEARRLPLALTWGMTEAASQVCTTFPGEIAAPGQVGPPLAFNQVRVDDDRLVIEGATVAERVMTTDRGSIATDGHVHVEGRVDDVIISGGRKISLAALESTIAAYPGVREVAVLGRSDAHWGQRPIAVVTAQDQSLDFAELSDWLRERFSRYMVPRSWISCDALPRTLVGKIDRARLRQGLAIFVDEPDGFQGVFEFGGAGGGGHVGDPNEGVLQMNDGAEVLVRTDDVVPEGHGALRQTLNAQSDRQAVAMPHHLLEGGLGVDQGEPDPSGIVGSLNAIEGGGQHLLEADMGVFERPIEEQNSSPIDLVETGGDRNIEGHNRALSEGYLQDE